MHCHPEERSDEGSAFLNAVANSRSFALLRRRSSCFPRGIRTKRKSRCSMRAVEQENRHSPFFRPTLSRGDERAGVAPTPHYLARRSCRCAKATGCCVQLMCTCGPRIRPRGPRTRTSCHRQCTSSLATVSAWSRECTSRPGERTQCTTPRPHWSTEHAPPATDRAPWVDERAPLDHEAALASQSIVRHRHRSVHHRPAACTDGPRIGRPAPTRRPTRTRHRTYGPTQRTSRSSHRTGRAAPMAPTSTAPAPASKAFCTNDQHIAPRLPVNCT
jgi:hypothetical protein